MSRKNSGRSDAKFRRVVQSVKDAGQQTAIDKVIGVFAPERAERRQRARMVMAAREAYQGASRTRRNVKEWDASTGSAITDTHPELPELRSRSRDVVRNMPVARGVIRRNVINVVGAGLKMRPKIDRETLGIDDDAAEEWQRNARAMFELWARECDMAGHDDFADLQALVLSSCLVNGDLAVVRRFREYHGQKFGTKLELIEADRIANPRSAMDTRKIAGGIEVDMDGRPVAMHVLKVHPGDWWLPKTKDKSGTARLPIYDRDGMRQVLHVRYRERIGQLRGVPELAPVLAALKQLERFSEAELMAAVISAMFTVFITSDEDGSLEDLLPGQPDSSTDAENDLRLGNGMIMNLAPGEKIEIADSKRPNQQFDPFFKAIVQQIALALDLPFEVLMMTFQSSYSASRAALEVAWQMFQTRRAWLVKQFCQPAYEWWLAEAVARGDVTAPGFFTDPAKRAAYCRAEWIGPARMSIDPVKDAQADEKNIALGLETREAITAKRTGGDYTDNVRQLGKEEQLKKQHGLNAGMADTTSPSPSPDQPEIPADETQDDRPDTGDHEDESQGETDDLSN